MSLATTLYSESISAVIEFMPKLISFATSSGSNHTLIPLLWSSMPLLEEAPRVAGILLVEFLEEPENLTKRKGRGREAVARSDKQEGEEKENRN